MPLPEKVVEQIGRDTSQSPGWSFGLISFSGGILAIVLITYAGLTYGYQPYLANQTAKVQDEISQTEQSISPTDQTELINFYSQISNLQTLLQGHTNGTAIFTWLENHTESNVYWSAFSYSNSGTMTLTANAKSEADANQQIAVLESAPEITTLTISGIAFTDNVWQFTANITIDPTKL